ncbi:sensor histidine kinase [Aquimarina sp. I32.4]|uniref:sensor histidine kinase n=1 Tax=Aquimarina sp. I32.4 TaxID=2053903 RepID=UPI000CDEEA29|nr:histidine kinase [Aquimarina sp. I32.4]
MAKLDSWIDNKVVQNLFVWFCFFLVIVGAIQGENKIITSLGIILLLAPAIYISNLLILPLIKKKTILFTFLFILNILVFTTISVFIINFISEQFFQWDKFINFFGIMVLAIAFGTAIKIARDNFLRRQQIKEAELKLLKAQLNPHFLFNTLNNLYGLSVIKSDKLPSLMLKLSDLLRYSLYDTKETLVPLEKEITYLENYISLEKIRLEDKTDIQFTKSGNLSSNKIAPMLLIVFVENAFKHLGILKNGKSSVIISLEEMNNTITFVCNNTIEVNIAKENDLEKGRSGIGLQNVKKRLALMYPEKHQLNINKMENSYNVQLIIDL